MNVEPSHHGAERAAFRTPGRAVVSAFCASLIGIGLARFAYTPLLPAIVDAGWFGPSAAAYIAAANLAGYLAGALLARAAAARLTTAAVLRGTMVLATASFFACSYPIGFIWYSGWRFAAGAAGGALMVLAAPTVLPHVPASRRGLVGGLIFMGIGIGVVISGTLIPLLLQQGLPEAWVGLGLLSLVLTLCAWSGWPARSEQASPQQRDVFLPNRRRLHSLNASYALNAAAWVPHMVFLVDYVARGRGEGITTGAQYWVLFGVGATLGPVFVGLFADRFGFATALRLAFVLEGVAIAVPGLGLGGFWLMMSSVVVGAFVTGTVPLVLGRISELLPHHPAQQRAAWSNATAAFALLQAAAAYAFSLMFSLTGGSYQALFLLGSGAMAMALIIDLSADARKRN